MMSGTTAHSAVNEAISASYYWLLICYNFIICTIKLTSYFAISVQDGMGLMITVHLWHLFSLYYIASGNIVLFTAVRYFNHINFTGKSVFKG